VVAFSLAVTAHSRDKTAPILWEVLAVGVRLRFSMTSKATFR